MASVYLLIGPVYLLVAALALLNLLNLRGRHSWSWPKPREYYGRTRDKNGQLVDPSPDDFDDIISDFVAMREIETAARRDLANSRELVGWSYTDGDGKVHP